MKVIAILNQKGGVGKTTSAVNLAAALVRSGKRVLLVDLDAQAGATQWMLGAYGPDGRTIRDLLLESRPINDTIIQTRGGFDLIPSNLRLAKLDLELALRSNNDGRLAKALKKVTPSYDLCLIDCPPWLGTASMNALVAANTVLIPIDCRAQALEAVSQVVELVIDVSDAHEKLLPIYALPTFFESRVNISREILELIKERFKSQLYSPIHKNTRLAEAYAARRTIFELDTTCAGAVDYHRVAKEIEYDLSEEDYGSRIRGVAE